MSEIIIFAGRKQAGKDTSCIAAKEIIENRLHSQCEIIAFADALKEIAINVFGLPRHLVYGSNEDKNQLTHIKWGDLPIKPETWSTLALNHSTPERPIYTDTYMTVREFLKVFGTDICRKIFSDCWVYAATQKIESSSADFILISDCRFGNEIDGLLKYNPLIFQLLRSIDSDAHPSESGLQFYPWDKLPNYYEIDNRYLTLPEKNNIIKEKVYSYFI